MNSRIHPRLFVLAGIAFLSTTSYILGSHLLYKTGYPLDDAWIYQTYARNLAEMGEWAFIPGAASGGSTGPMWVVLLTIGYMLHINHQIWAYAIGSIVLFGLGIVGMYAFEQLQPERKKWALIAGSVVILEWHLVWASASGMETLLFSLIVTFTLVYLFKPKTADKEWFLVGLLAGISVWIRPDGITLLGPIAFSALIGKQKGKHLLWAALGFALPFSIYLLFNQVTAGTVWPNTFYAKQTEYSSLRNTPFISRLGQQILTPLVGVGIILLPGFIYTIYQAIKERIWGVLAAIFWLFGFLGIYAWRLPVTYQHGRYIIPAMPIFFIVGIAGTIFWISRHFQDERMIPRVLSKTWLFSCAGVLGLFWILGVRSYAWDVAVIESEMVITANWINQNTASDAVIAAHDIGALGYFSQRQIVDLAGLISPDVIPFIRDEAQLATYLDTQKAEYLMTFPGWYPSLVTQSTLIYQTNGIFSPELGGENMAVYRWDIRDTE